MNILVSMCLLGIPCRYNKTRLKIILPDDFIDTNIHTLIPVCPEQLGGMSTPRSAFEIVTGDGYDVIDKKCRIISIEKNDVTNEVLAGAELTLKLAKKYNAVKFIGCSRSPSCSCKKIYNGKFNGTLKNGCGVAAALLECNGIELIDSNDLFNTIRGKLNEN
jgi:uncharacterized protein YbbK (DUF523 family)